MRKPAFCICGNKGADQLRGKKTKTQINFAVTAKLISAFVFATQTHVVQSVCFLNPKSHVSSHLLWLYSPVFMSDLVGNPEDRFSHNEAHLICMLHVLVKTHLFLKTSTGIKRVIMRTEQVTECHREIKSV